MHTNHLRLTRHARKRMAERGITLFEVEQALARPRSVHRTWTDDGREARKYVAGRIHVVVGLGREVVTVCVRGGSR